jgi:Flp pilus assembly protein TadD
MNYGLELANKGNLKEAAEAILEAIKLKPDFPEAYNNLGMIFISANCVEAAEQSLRLAIKLRPNFSEPYNNLGVILQKSKRLDEAEIYFRRAVELNPNNAEVYKNLGAVLYETNRRDEAVNCFRLAINLNANCIDAHYYLGMVMLQANRLEEAEVYFRQVLALKPDHTKVEFNLGLLYLLDEQYEKGWEKYEARCKMPGTPRPEVRRWQGEDLTGHKILLYHEQGLGDTIHFFRYAEKVAELAGETIVWVQKPLERLLAACETNFIVRSGDNIPLSEYNFDFACPLLSLPLMFNTSRETIPHKIPYIFPQQNIAAKWSKILDKIDGGELYRIGVVWSGNPKYVNDRNRSIPLDILGTLFTTFEVSWISLQLGRQVEALRGMSCNVADISGELTDFAETAGAIANIDLVITVDTAVAHLSGSMGKDTWLLLPFSPDWRWQLDREDCPWYSTLRLFRQRSAGDWLEVLDKIKVSLAEQLNKNYRSR